MRRRLVSDDEINSVIRLKQLGASWLKIEEKTRVPRRTAKRAYEDWQKEQTFAELKESRREVAAEAFREHVNSLIKLGRFLAMLDIPIGVPTAAPDAAQFLDRLWQSNILGDVEYYQLPQGSAGTDRESRDISRQNRMLFESLREHTRGQVGWQALKEWENAWDNCRPLYARLQKEATKVVQNFLAQESDLEKRNRTANQGVDALTQIVDALLRAIWSGILEDTLDSERDLLETIGRRGGDTDLTRTGVGNSTLLVFSDKNLAERTAHLGNQAAKNLLLGDNKSIIDSLKKDISAMRRATEALAEMLNPLVLRPVLLRTRCNLCPA